RLAPPRFAPAIVTRVPAWPEVGEKEEIAGCGVGGAVTAKSLPLIAVPPGVVTAMRPVAAFAGTVAEIWLAESTPKLAGVLPKVTVVAPVKFVPVSVTVDPGGPDVGEKLEIVGGEGEGGAGVEAIIHGARGVVSPARYWKVPRSAGVAPSQ